MRVFRQHPRRSWLAVSQFLLAVYVSAAGLSPLLHHDVICHLQSPTHCTTCLIGSTAEGPSVANSSSGSPLVAIGPAFEASNVLRDAALPGELSGRSPPVQD